LFCGSDDHAQAAGNLLTLIASARLHGLDPEQYLRDLSVFSRNGLGTATSSLRPSDWTATRARIEAAQLDIEIGWITIPPPPEQVVGELIARLPSRIHGAITFRAPEERG
jgi:transposase